MGKGNYTELVRLLQTGNEDNFTESEKRSIKRCANYFGQLEDHVLVEVTRFAMATCAFRLVLPNPDEAIPPTPELLKHGLTQTLTFLQKSVEDDF